MRNFEHFFDLLNMVYEYRKGSNKTHAVKIWEIYGIWRLTQEDKLLFKELQK